MNGLIEISVAAVIIAVIFYHRAAQKWLAEIGPFNRQIAFGLLVFMMVGQVLNQSRTLFPFVRWSMYTEICEDEQLALGKFQALHANGVTSWVNPTLCYPSISRNNHERNQLVITRLRDGELSPYVTNLFDQYMSALGVRHSDASPGNPVIEVRAVLQEVAARRNQIHKKNQVVRTVKVQHQPPAQIASAVK